jgi:hypothetical protein
MDRMAAGGEDAVVGRWRPHRHAIPDMFVEGVLQYLRIGELASQLVQNSVFGMTMECWLPAVYVLTAWPLCQKISTDGNNNDQVDFVETIPYNYRMV